MASEAALSLLIQLRDEASAGIAALGGNVEQLGRQAEQQQGMFGRLFGVVSGVGVAAFAGMAVGAAGAATAGFSLNNAMEMTSAKINAFTKDGAKTAEILAMIQERASKTPFEFQAMADSAAALLPVSKASGIGLEDLISKAEILAASNPAEGLEGAAFALKEAVSGDFTSVIERFNLPRQYLNQLKEQGVPAAEAVSMAMQQLGLDSDLVSNLAETASGRWSTFKDTMQGLAATVTAPIFDMFSAGLGQVNGLLESAAPALTAVATSIGEGLAGALQGAQAGLSQFGAIASQAFAAFQEGGIGAALNTLLSGITPMLSELGTTIQTWITTQGPLIVAQLGTWGAAFVEWISTAIPLIVAKFLELETAIWEWIKGAAPQLATQLGEWAVAFVGWLPDAISQLLAGLAGVIGAITTWIVEHGPDIIATLASWGAGFGAWVLDTALPALLGALGELWTNFTGWLSENGPSILAQLSTWGAAFGTWVTETALPALTTALGELWTNFTGWLVEKGPGILTQLGEWAVAFGAWVRDTALPNLLTALGELWTSLSGWVGETTPKIVAKVLEWGAAFLGWVGTEVVPKIPGVLADILTAISGWISTSVKWITDEAKKIGSNIIDGIKSGISAGVSALTSAVQNAANDALNAAKKALGIASPSREFAQQVGLPIAQGIALGFSQGMPKVTTNLVNGVAGLMEKVASAVENGSKALAAVSGFQGSSGSGLSGFLAGIKDLAIQFNDAAVLLGGRILGTATRFADTIGKVTAPIDGALKALGGLVDFIAPARANITAFIAGMYVLLNALNNMAVMFEAKAIKAAAVFAEGAAKMLAVVGPAIDALKKLPDLVSPTWAQVNLFGEALFRIVTELLNVAALFESRALQAGALFGEAGAKLLAVVGPAIEALKKLPDLVVPADGALAVFGDALGRTVQALIQVAGFFAQDAVDAAAKFSEGAGKTIAIVGSAVDGFTKLADFAGVPQAAIDAFGVALAATLVRLIAVAQTFTTEAIAAAAVFGEGTGKALAMIGATVDGFVKLADFAGVGDAAIVAFGAAITATVARLVQVAAGFEQSTIDAAAAFGAGVGKALSGIGAAVDSLAKLIDFKAPADRAIQAFFLAVAGIMERMDSWSAFFNERMYASTAAFSDGIKGAVANLGGIADSLAKLIDFKAPADASVKAFFLAIGGIMERLDSWSVTINTRMIETATAFTGGIEVVITQLRNALQAFASLGDTKAMSATVLTAFMGSLTALVNQMAAYLPPNAEVIGANTIVGLINGIYSQRSNLIGAMTNTVLAAVQAAQATLGIASPSKVFEQIGQYTGQGMAGGMSAMQPAVASAGAGLGMAAVGGAAGSAGGSRAGGGSGRGDVIVNIAAGAISVNGVQGGLNSKHLKELSGYLKEDIAGEMRGR